MGYDAKEWGDLVEPHVERHGDESTPDAVEFPVPGRPVPWQRRESAGGGRSWTPQRTREYEERVGLLGRAAGLTPRSGPVAVEIDVYVSDGRVGDVDNYAKAVLDGLTGVAYEDDRQVVRLVVERHRADVDGVTVRVCGVRHEG